MKKNPRLEAVKAVQQEFATLGINPFGVQVDRIITPTLGMIGGRPTIMAGTNNYLGMTFDAGCVAAAHAALDAATAPVIFSHSSARALSDHPRNVADDVLAQGNNSSLVQIDKGLALGMSFPHIGYYDRAVAYQLMGRYKEAYYDYKKVLEIEPTFAAASERLKDFVVTRTPANTQS